MWFFWWLLTVSFLKFIDMISWMTKTNEVRFLRSLDELDPITQNMKSWTFYWLMECFIMKNIKFHLEYIFVQSPDKMCMELFRFYPIYAIKCHYTWPIFTWPLCILYFIWVRLLVIMMKFVTTSTLDYVLQFFGVYQSGFRVRLPLGTGTLSKFRGKLGFHPNFSTIPIYCTLWIYSLISNLK